MNKQTENETMINQAVLNECIQAVLFNRVEQVKSKPGAKEQLWRASLSEIETASAKLVADAQPDIMALYIEVMSQLEKDL